MRKSIEATGSHLATIPTLASMSLQLVIPGQVGLHQSLLALRQPEAL